MGHNQPGRLTVDLGGKWRLYTNTTPAGSKCLGTVTTQHGETGALIITAAGTYARLNAGALVSLPQNEVQAAVEAARAGAHGGPGRGQGLKAADGATGLKRRNISIDDASADTLRQFGDGDLSLGIRRAATHIKAL